MSQSEERAEKVIEAIGVFASRIANPWYSSKDVVDARTQAVRVLADVLADVQEKPEPAE